jgi:hypothetical protein
MDDEPRHLSRDEKDALDGLPLWFTLPLAVIAALAVAGGAVYLLVIWAYAIWSALA